MSAPLDMNLIESRLREAVQSLESVGSAADYAAIKSLASCRPACAYVVLVSERKINDGQKQAQQRPRGRAHAEATIGVIITARNYRDNLGASASDGASPLIGAVRDALCGWTPGSNIMRPLEWHAGDVLDYNTNLLLWAETFTTTHFVGGNTQ